ncbi:class I SAM-dependent methyltransferase [Pseudonocardia asaccharolytica]|uniref:Methyltransferase n=1 Tax=Pseudonocardia asaccharolytica DSM 44247 = NBRC 16224 TaxID=1123024 RepID=A0A511CYW2_9PSEU|nr:class I SAM-dependent methyltransferase [Pseudonocardia asaccharolytica]GEL17745.1 methyltransferase [Pseudonocardia asaccharolytica DSM 44247 = NBRC 16224]
MTYSMRIDASNAEQARFWDGDEGGYWAEHAARLDAAIARHHRRFLEAAAIPATARVLDIGCGTGQTTRDAARRASAGSALGVDLSSQMIEVARRIAEREGVTNAWFEQADAQVHPFAQRSFDLAISRTGAMFFGDPQTAFSNIARAVRPGGRLVLLVWQPATRNEWIIAFSTALAVGRDLPPPPQDAPGPFSLSDPERIRDLLTRTGFGEPRIASVNEPMYFGSGVEDTYRFLLGLLGWMLEGLDDDGRARGLDALRATIAAHHTEQGVNFDSAAWLVTADRG